MQGGKIAALTSNLAEQIEKGYFGASGSRFLRARDLAATYSISLESTCRILDRLAEMHLICLIGKHYYVTTGYASPDTPLGQYMKETRRPLFGLVSVNLDNPFYASLAQELMLAVEAVGFGLLVAGNHGDPEVEMRVMDQLTELGISGIFACRGGGRHRITCPLPVVVLGSETDLQDRDAVLVDNRAAGRQAGEHLKQIGCNSFAYVGIRALHQFDPRLEGFRDSLKSGDFSLTSERIFGVERLENGKPNTDSLPGMLNELLRSRKSDEKIGIFCYHDLLAAAVLKYIRHWRTSTGEHLRIPEDVAIVGFDDLPIAEALTPSLTTVSYRFDSIARKSVEVMMDCIRNPKHRCTSYRIPSSLIVRESTVRITSNG